MEYKLLRSSYLELDAQVNQYLSEGWELYGHPYCNDSMQYQAVVKGGPKVEYATATLQSVSAPANVYNIDSLVKDMHIVVADTPQAAERIKKEISEALISVASDATKEPKKGKTNG